MDRFYLIANMTKDPGLKTAGKIRKFLEERGKVCRLREQEGPGEGSAYTSECWVPDDTECILVLGGDGTLIQAARDLVHRQIPIYGINMGTLGYLTEVDHTSYAGVLDKIIAGDYFVEERMMLKGQLFGPAGLVCSDRALNDIVITRKGSVRVVRFNIYVNGEFLSRYTADGILISTPTGSTAYNLSAGGPLAEPNASIMILTPISPHTLNNRSIVLPADARITVEAAEGFEEKGGECVASFDGVECGSLKPGERLEINKSSYTTKILRTSKVSFLEILRRKLSG